MDKKVGALEGLEPLLIVGPGQQVLSTVEESYTYIKSNKK